MSLRRAVGAQLSGLWHRARGTTPPPRPLQLALQGGGSHGAFTWGVLDRLLEDGRFDIASLSGTSAGALNAAVLATGLRKAGREGARAALAAFWRDVSASGVAFAPFLAAANSGLPAAQWANLWLRSASPYDFNPLNVNPLRDLLERHVEPAALHAPHPRLFVVATAVHTGRPRIWSGLALRLEVLLASACLPFLFQAVEIDGEPYWDGGYSGNPALYPLIEHTPDLDLLLVKINPLVRDVTPKTALEISERASEIAFNAALLGELRAIAAARRHKRAVHEALRLHMIADEDPLARLGTTSKLDTDLAFLERLFGLGRQAAAAWLDAHARDVGVRSTLDVERVFFGAEPPAPG